jgi:hypothetical protein
LRERKRDTSKREARPAKRSKVINLEVVDLRLKLNKALTSLLFAKSDTVYLGKDRNESAYFFNCNEPHRIYINYKPYFLQKSGQFLLYEGRQKISELLPFLCNKGFHEKRLSQQLSNILHKLAIICEADEVEQPLTDYPPPTIFDHALSRSKVVSYFLRIEKQLNDYFSPRSMQWAPEALRQKILAEVEQEESLEELA